MPQPADLQTLSGDVLAAAHVLDVTSAINAWRSEQDGDPDLLNNSDRVFEVLGHYVKIRRLPGPEMGFGVASWTLQGSMTGANGYALAAGEGHAIAPLSLWVMQSDSADYTPAQQLAATLQDKARETIRAAIVESAKAML